ncbi:MULTISPECIES: hypothetical protein [unclassified Paraburkholderia]|uniref:hypothetical protein n=1 Tax=unclassified Paraburkholderia TaxID=2615204 RepID=UPI0021A2662B|nr:MULTISPECIES: hypothetical protein [unclassified Paraburkholderia]
MDWPHVVSYFFGGVLFANAVPHFVSGVMGHPFQSPFAKPSGKGLSSSTVNVLWGFFNMVVGYLLVFRVGDFRIEATGDAVPFGLGILATGMLCARLFGPLHGGNIPKRT